MEYTLFCNKVTQLLSSITSNIEDDDSDLQYEAILEFLFASPPYNLAKKLFGKGPLRSKLQDKLNLDIINYSDIVLGATPKYLAKVLSKELDTEAVLIKVSLVIFTKGIYGISYYYDGDYVNGFSTFRWALKFLYNIDRIPIVRNNLDFSDYEKFYGLLCAKCLVLDGIRSGLDWYTHEPIHCNIDETSILQGILYGIVKKTNYQDMQYGNRNEQNKLSTYFQLLGDLMEGISIFGGKFVEYENIQNTSNIALKIDQNAIDDMVTKYIISVSLKIPGDPSIVYCFNKIIQGIILYGEVDINILTYFNRLKLYYSKFTYRNLYGDSINDNQLDADKSDLTEECILFSDNVIKEWKAMNAGHHVGVFLLPSMLLRTIGGSLIMVDELISRPPKYETNKFVTNMRLRMRSKWHDYEGRFTNTVLTRPKADRGLNWLKHWRETNYFAAPIDTELECIVNEVDVYLNTFHE